MNDCSGRDTVDWHGLSEECVLGEGRYRILSGVSDMEREPSFLLGIRLISFPCMWPGSLSIQNKGLLGGQYLRKHLNEKETGWGGGCSFVFIWWKAFDRILNQRLLHGIELPRDGESALPWWGVVVGTGREHKWALCEWSGWEPVTSDYVKGCETGSAEIFLGKKMYIAKEANSKVF